MACLLCLYPSTGSVQRRCQSSVDRMHHRRHLHNAEAVIKKEKMKAEIRSVEFAPGKTLSVELGRLAKQAHGATVIRMGDTMVLATAVSNYEAKEGQDFFPLTVEFRETFAAGGRFPGGFIKREGRPSEKEILSCRIIDRTIRPLFPDGYYNETQVICQVISSDRKSTRLNS